MRFGLAATRQGYTLLHKPCISLPAATGQHLAYRHPSQKINSRYGDVEKRVLKFFADDPGNNAIQLPGAITDAGREFIDQWLRAGDLEQI